MKDKNYLYVEKIYKHLDVLTKDIQLLEKLLKEHNYDADSIAQSPYHLMATERLLERIAINIIDISFMLVKYYKIGTPRNYRDGLQILCDKGILSKELCKSLDGLIGVRNILVHEYTTFKLEKVEQDLKQKTKDFYQFVKEIEKLLQTPQK